MKKAWSGLKARLARLKPWLKAHWKVVLVVLVSAAIFLYIVLKKPGLASAALNPPATAGSTGNGTDPTATTTQTVGSALASAPSSLGAAAAGQPVDPPGLTPIGSSTATSNTAGSTVTFSRAALPTAVARPQPFSLPSLPSRQAGGAFGPGSAAFAMAHGPVTGATLKTAEPTPAPTGPSGISQMLAAAQSLASRVASAPAPTGPSGISQMLAAAQSLASRVASAPKPAPAPTIAWKPSSSPRETARQAIRPPVPAPVKPRGLAQQVNLNAGVNRVSRGVQV